MNISIFLAILSFPVITNTTRWQNLPGRPLSLFPQCGIDKIKPVRRNNPIDFNPALLNYGQIGNPSFKLRFNWKEFQYANSTIAQMLNQQIRNARIPQFNECLPEINGCAQFTNILITNFCFPQNIVSFPASPNKIAFNIQHFDLSLSGQLNIEVVFLLPTSIFCGTLCIDARLISISAEVAIERNQYNGVTYVQMTKCSSEIGYLNLYIVNGGLIGEFINNFFRGKIISKIYETLPGKFCDMIPTLLDEHVNSRLINFPHRISIKQLFPSAFQLIKKPIKLPKYCYSDVCKFDHLLTISSSVIKKLTTKAIYTAGVTNLNNLEQHTIAINKPLLKLKFSSNETLSETVTLKDRSQQQSFLRAKMSTKFPQKMRKLRKNEKIQKKEQNMDQTNKQRCDNCDYEMGGILAYIREALMNRIQICASDLVLSIHFLNLLSTKYDSTINFLGEFTTNLNGYIPFASPLIQYPIGRSGKMFDLLISDHILNTLLYHLHRKDVFAFRIGPELPFIGDLLNFTCGETDSDSILKLKNIKIRDATNETITLNQINSIHNRMEQNKTKDASFYFGFCLGDFTPELREKYLGKQAYILFRTSRAPFIQFFAARSGTIVIEFTIDGLIFVDGTTIKVGNIQLLASLNLTVEFIGNRIFGKAEFENFNIVDVDKIFGIFGFTLIFISYLARQYLTAAINKQLADGIPLVLSQPSLPLQFNNIHFQIIEHAILISTDATIAPFGYSVSYQKFPSCLYYN